MLLIRTCAGLQGAVRWGCYVWFGRTLAVTTDGRFLRGGCTRLTAAAAENACRLGAKRMDRPLRTFS
jgi:hypothetical protein